VWTTDGAPEHFPDGDGGYDGDWWKWWLVRDDARTFIVVKAPRHVVMGAGDLSDRTARAAATNGLSEVERHLGDDVPPRVIELRTGGGEPFVTSRD
jgi:hypothetical protein